MLGGGLRSPSAFLVKKCFPGSSLALFFSEQFVETSWSTKEMIKSFAPHLLKLVMYISVQRRRRKKEEEALQQSPRRAAHESCSDLGEKTLHSSLQVPQPALKGNGY